MGLAAAAAVSLAGARGALLVVGAAVPALVATHFARRGFSALDGVAQGRVAKVQLLRGVDMFSRLRLDGLEAVAAALRPVEVPAGTVVVEQDDACAGDWYLIHAGELEVAIDGYEVNTLGPGDAFGERALMRREPRSATVRALTAASLHALARADFLNAIAGPDVSPLGAVPTGDLRDEGAPGDPLAALARQPALHTLAPGALAALAAAGEHREITEGAELFREGDADDCYFVVLGGELRVLLPEGRHRRVRPGDCVGEISVLHRRPRTATVVAHTGAALFCVPGDPLRTALTQADPRGEAPARST